MVQTFDDCTLDRRSAFTIFKGVKKWTTLLDRHFIVNIRFNHFDWTLIYETAKQEYTFKHKVLP